MILQTEALVANAVLNVRFSNSSITSGAAEIYIYGTAVVLESGNPNGEKTRAQIMKQIIATLVFFTLDY